MTSLRRNHSGTTLMELMVYLAISTIVVLGMTTFVSALTRSRVSTSNQQVAQSELRNVVERMTYAVRNSREIAISGNRVDLTDESGRITSYCACDGTMKSGSNLGVPPGPADLEIMVDPAVSVVSSHFEKVSSSLRLTLTLAVGGRESTMTSTIAYRQNP